MGRHHPVHKHRAQQRMRQRQTTLKEISGRIFVHGNGGREEYKKEIKIDVSIEMS